MKSNMDLFEFFIYLAVSYFFWDMFRGDSLTRKSEPWVRNINWK